MATVTDTATAGLAVQVTLKYPDTGVSAPEAVYNDVVDADGTYSIELVPNDSILPGNSYYEIVVDPDGTPATKNVKVPSSMGGSFDADAIAFDPTPTLTPADATLAVAITRIAEIEAVLKGHGILT